MVLHGFWQDGAVIQQGTPYTVAGTDCAGPRVSVRLLREEDDTELDRVDCPVENGRFSAVMPGRKGGMTLCRLLCVCDGEETAVCRHVLFGEVWLTSGQSNMEFSLRLCADGDKAAALYSPYIRYLNISKPADAVDGAFVKRAPRPLDTLSSDGWRTADTAENAASMSGVSFFMAAELLERLGVPIGVISTAFGGTTIEAWLPRVAVEADAGLLEHLRRTGRYNTEEEANTLEGRNYTQLSGLYNERIAPLRGTALRGMLWLQGESSAGSEEEARFYAAALRTLVHAWRGHLGGDLPCVVVDIAAENYQFEPLAVPHLNEGIAAAVETLDSVWEVPIYDLPLTWRIEGTTDGHPIHPSEKSGVGKRTASVACTAVYGLDTGGLAPRLLDAAFEGERAVVRFQDVGDGLRCGEETLRGFTLCGENGVHVEARAHIAAPDTVEITHPAVRRASGFSYAYALYNQRANLRGSGGVPAVACRRDTVEPLYTEPREWLYADTAAAFESCFESALGGAGYRPLWLPGSLCGTPDAEVTVAGGVSLRYRTDWRWDSLAGVSPEIGLTGRYHGLDSVGYLDITLDNPDPREKEFAGILISTVRGRRYYLPVVQGEERRVFVPLAAQAQGAVYRVDLHAFFGCYLAPETKEPADVSDMTAMELVFRDTSPEPGRIIIRQLTPGFWQ